MYTAYVIVAVHVDDADRVLSMNIDHTAAPWPDSDSAHNVWDDDAERWIRGYRFADAGEPNGRGVAAYDAASEAIIAAVLAYAGTDDRS